MSNKHTQMLQVIYDFWKMPPEKCYPEVTLNHICGICGDDAIELILECEKFLGAPYGTLVKKFPFDTYFDPEVEPLWKQFVLFLLTPLVIILLFFDFCQICIYKILGKKIEKPYDDNDNGKPPLTASQFADIMIDLWEDYQKEGSKKCP